MPTKQKGGSGGYKSTKKRVTKNKDEPMRKRQLKDKEKLLKIEKKKEEKEKKHRCKSEIIADEKRSIGRQEKKQNKIEDTLTNKARAKLERIDLLDEKKESKRDCPRYTQGCIYHVPYKGSYK